MSEREKVPNRVLRRIREEERHESRAEFAEALAAAARRLGEQVFPSERYIARLEDGEIRYPTAPYRRILTALCHRSMAELGFAPRVGSQAALARPLARTTAIPAGAEPEWPVWFAVRTNQLVTMIDSWRDTTDQLDSLQATLHAEALMFDAMAADDQRGPVEAHALSRRHALATLATLPLAISVTAGRAGGQPIGAFLARSAASLTACWHLMRGTDMKTVHQVISSYITNLEGLSGQRSAYQPTAARLASQAHRILGIVATHRADPGIREAHARQAIFYGQLAGDPDFHAAGLLCLASNYYYSGRPDQYAAACDQVLGLGSAVAPLLRARAHVYRAVASAQLGRQQQALESMRNGESAYPDRPEADRSFLFAEFTPAQLALWLGVAHAELAELGSAGGHERKAADIFDGFRQQPGASSERTRCEIINHQAITAVALGDLEVFESYMTEAIAGVAVLGSRQRRREALQAWHLATRRWPDDSRLRSLAEGSRSLANGTREPGRS